MLAEIKSLPKVDLHRHFEGSVRLSTLVDIARAYRIPMPKYDLETLRPFVQMMPDDPRHSQHFLSKFLTLRQFYRSVPIIQRIAREIVQDAAADNVRYLELRFTPKALNNVIDCSIADMVPIVCETANDEAAKQGIKVRYIVSMNRHESVELGREALDAAVANRDQGVVGLDLAGDEANYSALPFRDLFLEAKEAGLGVTIHAGEWNDASSVWDAINRLQADRIGHGINVLLDRKLLDVIREREIVLEVCPSSNLLSGVVDHLNKHPLIALAKAKIPITINTDDPTVCNITLSDEIYYAMQHMGLTLADVKSYTLQAVKAAFLPEDERKSLARQFETWFEKV